LNPCQQLKQRKTKVKLKVTKAIEYQNKTNVNRMKKIKGGPVNDAPTKWRLGSVDVCNLATTSREAVSNI
jgi:hypothetical protein